MNNMSKMMSDFGAKPMKNMGAPAAKPLAKVMKPAGKPKVAVGFTKTVSAKPVKSGVKTKAKLSAFSANLGKHK